MTDTGYDFESAVETLSGLTIYAVTKMTEAEVLETFKLIRWPTTNGKPVCPKCQCKTCYPYKARPIWNCKHCHHQFSVTSGTRWAARKKPLRVYLTLAAGMFNPKERESLLALSERLQLQYKTVHARAKQWGAPKDRRRRAPLQYPFLSTDKMQGADLLMKVHRIIPRDIPAQIRDDICQELVMGVLSGEVNLENLSTAAPRFIRKLNKMFPTKFGPISLDAPIGREGARKSKSLHEIIPSTDMVWN